MPELSPRLNELRWAKSASLVDDLERTFLLNAELREVERGKVFFVPWGALDLGQQLIGVEGRPEAASFHDLVATALSAHPGSSSGSAT